MQTLGKSGKVHVEMTQPCIRGFLFLHLFSVIYPLRNDYRYYIIIYIIILYNLATIFESLNLSRKIFIF